MRVRHVLPAITALGCLLAAAPAADAGVRTYTLRSGPFLMGGFNTRMVKRMVPTPGVDGFVVLMHARLVDGRGRPVTIRDVMLHHVVFRRRWTVRRADECTSPLGEAFYGTGEEDQSLRLPRGYGYRERTGDRWRMNAMLMSHSTRTMRVYVQYRVTVVTGKRLTPVRAFWVRANGCGAAVSYGIHGGGGVARKSFRWRVPVSGRIVAAGGHLHGGSEDMWMSQPRCGNRRLYDNRPSFGMPDNLYYRARPVLHEPGPVDTRYFLSRTGIPVRRGERLRLTAAYDNSHWHSQVMAITHVYVAPSRRIPARCRPLPRDRRELRKAMRVRPHPPAVWVPLTGLNAAGHTFTVLAPPQPAVRRPARTTVKVEGAGFGPPHISVPLGAHVTWRFVESDRHNVRIANGPALTSTATLTAPATHTSHFKVAGRYELFCSLHPVTMHEIVDVRPG
jgi:plastocyanin